MTGDAGNCSVATAGEVYRLGGDYLLQVKGNQPTAQAFCENTFENLSLPPPAISKSNGRVSERSARAVQVTPCAINIPFSRSMIRVVKKTTCKRVVKNETFHYVTNRDVSGWTQEDLLEMTGTHWKSCEIGTHWIRDAQYKEDRILQRKPVAILNRSLLINAAAFITNTLRKREGKSTPVLREAFQRHPSKALALITRPFDASIPF